MCSLQVPVTVDSVSAIPKTGGCLESTVNATTESVTNTMASFAQVNTLELNVEMVNPYLNLRDACISGSSRHLHHCGVKCLVKFFLHFLEKNNC